MEHKGMTLKVAFVFEMTLYSKFLRSAMITNHKLDMYVEFLSEFTSSSLKFCFPSHLQIQAHIMLSEWENLVKEIKHKKQHCIYEDTVSQDHENFC